jgi:hypothetical protein
MGNKSFSFSSKFRPSMVDQTMMSSIFNSIAAADNFRPLKQRKRKRNTETIIQFQLLLKNETWDTVYKDNDTNTKFNSFLLTFLIVFEASFQIKYISIGKLRNEWITQGIKTSCKNNTTSTLGAVMTQKLENFTLHILKS